MKKDAFSTCRRLIPGMALALSLSVAADVCLSAFDGPRFIALAQADDDGDDGGGSGGGGGGGGSGGGYYGGSPPGAGDVRRFFGSMKRKFLPQRRAARRAAAPAPPPAPREIVGLDITDQELAGLVSGGFEVMERAALTVVGTTVTRLLPPARLSLDEAKAEIVAQAPQAVVDDNHGYTPQSERSAACAAPGCLAREVISWNVAVEASASCIARARLGMIDTGINTEHAVLKDARIEVVRFGEASSPKSGLQHGTAIAALLVGAADSRAPGLLPGASLIAVDTFSKRPQGDVSDAFNLVRGMDFLISREVDVVNLSLSGPHNAVLERSVAKAGEANVLLVAAAGNEGPRAGAVYPAAYPGVVAVTAVDRQKKPYRRAGQGEHIDLAAPGVNVWTAASVSGARTRTGTSYAAPFVSAAAALWIAGAEKAQASQAISALTGQAEDLGDPGKDHVFGWGLVRPRSACAPAAP